MMARVLGDLAPGDLFVMPNGMPEFRLPCIFIAIVPGPGSVGHQHFFLSTKGMMYFMSPGHEVRLLVKGEETLG